MYFIAQLLYTELTLKSHILMYPLELENRNMSLRLGWYSTNVITSASSSMLGGFKSTKLKAISLFSILHKLTRKSSADKKFYPSGDTLKELIL